MAYGRRKKGGQALMELAKKSRKAKKPRVGGKRYVTPLSKSKATKSKASDRARTEINTPKGIRLRPVRAVEPPLRKMKGGTNLAARAGQVDPTKRTPKQPTRTPAQRAAAKKKLQAEQKTLRKKSAGMRYGSEFKIPELGKKEQDAMARAMESGSGGGLIKAGVGAALTAAALKAHKWYKAKKAADLARATAKAKRAAAAARKAAEAKKGVSGIGAARAESALARTSGLGKAKPKPKPKAKKKKSAAQTKRESMRGASAWR